MPPYELLYLNAFNSMRGVGTAALRVLNAAFGAYENAWRASDAMLAGAGLPPQTVAAIIAGRKNIDPERAAEVLQKNGIAILADDNPAYPSPLKEIPNPPIALYVRGHFDILCQKVMLAVVGTRRPTRYGLDAAKSISGALASSGVAIASGLAIGIDAAAHAATLEARGVTVAILGSGTDERSIFPQGNVPLARRIIESGGAVISEYPPGTPAFRAYFPQRNRIISGLSKGVLVVEARERSGALITARFALEHNRDVFAIPHPIGAPAGVGPNRLIQEGAKLILTAGDILAELGIAYQAPIPQLRVAATETESCLLNFLDEPKTPDEIAVATGLAIASVMSSLTTLELKGLVANVGGNAFRRTV